MQSHQSEQCEQGQVLPPESSDSASRGERMSRAQGPLRELREKEKELSSRNKTTEQVQGPSGDWTENWHTWFIAI